MSIPRLTINGMAMPYECYEIKQTYEDFGGFGNLRSAAGSAIPQSRWERIRTTLTGGGWIPPGFGAFNWRAPVTLGCVAAKSIQSAGNAIPLPSARRNDVAPYGFAVMPSGLQVPTPVASLVGNLLTLTAVAGAEGYTALYYPLLTVITPGPTETTDTVGLVIGWQLTAEED